MSGLRLGTHGLLPPDVARVRTLMERLGQLDDFSWRFSARGPFDALIVNGAQGGRDPQRPATRALIPLAEAAEREMGQALRADRLAAWLHRLEQEFTRADVPVLESPLPVAGRDGAVMPPHLYPLPAGRYRLRRWPPMTALRDDPRRICMATLLTRRSLTLAELANLSAQPGDACLRFVRSLQSKGLIDVTDEVGPPLATPRGGGLGAARAWAVRLRRRLGLGAAAS